MDRSRRFRLPRSPGQRVGAPRSAHGRTEPPGIRRAIRPTLFRVGGQEQAHAQRMRVSTPETDLRRATLAQGHSTRAISTGGCTSPPAAGHEQAELCEARRMAAHLGWRSEEAEATGRSLHRFPKGNGRIGPSTATASEASAPGRGDPSTPSSLLHLLQFRLGVGSAARTKVGLTRFAPPQYLPHVDCSPADECTAVSKLTVAPTERCRKRPTLARHSAAPGGTHAKTRRQHFHSTEQRRPSQRQKQ